MFAIKIDGVTLTQRETECLFYLIRGMTAKEIGRVLNLSRRTVEGYILSTRNKLNCTSRSEVIGRAWDNHFPFEKLARELPLTDQTEVVH